MSDETISIPISNRTVNKIRALNLLSGRTPDEVTSVFVNAFEGLLDDMLYEAIGGNTPQEPVHSVAGAPPLRKAEDVGIQHTFGTDVSGFAEGVGALESDPEDIPEDTPQKAPLTVGEREEVMDSLREMDRQASEPDDFMDSIQEDLQDGNLEPGDMFADPDIDALERESSQIQNYGVDNITTEGGAADFFMSHIEGQRVRTGIKSGAAKRVKISPAT